MKPTSTRTRYHYSKLFKYTEIGPHTTHIHAGGDRVSPSGEPGETLCGILGRQYHLVLPNTPELSSEQVCEACAKRYETLTGVAHTVRPSQHLTTPPRTPTRTPECPST